MDGRAFGHAPKQPADFINQASKSLHGRYLEDAKRGLFETDLVSFFERQHKRALQFESLFIVGRVAQLCGEAVAPLVSEELGKTTTAAQCAKQIQAQWYLGYFCGEIRTKELKSDAQTKTMSELRGRADAWQTGWQKVCKLEKRLANTPKHDKSYLRDHRLLGAATERYQSAREELVVFVAPKGKRFNPGEKYDEHWKRACEKYQVEQKRKAKSQGRGVMPDGGEVRNRRKQLDLSQAAFGKLVKLSTRTVNRVESGGRRVDLNTMTRIADYFGVELESLILSDTDSGAGAGPEAAALSILAVAGPLASELITILQHPLKFRARSA